MFGTPDEPFALPETGLDQRMLKMAAGPGVERQGRAASMACIAAIVPIATASRATATARPRRSSIRIRATIAPASSSSRARTRPPQPTDEDLHRIVHDGVPGTAMPSFALLPPDEVEALVEYVKYLSIRGQMETALENYVADELDPGDKFDPASDPAMRKLVMERFARPDHGSVEGGQRAGHRARQTDAIPPDNRTPEQVADVGQRRPRAVLRHRRPTA